MTFSQIPKTIFCQLKITLANLWYRYPSRKLTLIAITGDKGIQITALFIENILKQTGKNISLITHGTQSINNENIANKLRINTSHPNPFKLQRLLREQVYRGCDYSILEIPTEALQHKSLLSCKYKVVVLTCCHHSSSDDLSSKEEYMHRQSKLFLKAPLIILNKDDINYPYFTRFTNGKKLTYAVHNEAQIKALKIQSGDWGAFFYYINKNSVWKNQLSFDRSIKLAQHDTQCIPYALAAIGSAAALNIPEFRIKKGLETTLEGADRL